MNFKVDEFYEFFNGLSDDAKSEVAGMFQKKSGYKYKLSGYNNPTPVAVAIVSVIDENKNIKLIGVRRNIKPFIGGLAFPGGFCDNKETIEMSAHRELVEEVWSCFEHAGCKNIPNIPDVNLFKIEGSFKSYITETNNLLFFVKAEYVFEMKEFIDSDGVSLFDKTNQWLKSQNGHEVSEIVLLDETATLCFPSHASVLIQYFEQLRRMKALIDIKPIQGCFHKTALR